jgi:hypothetical protein
LEIGKHCQISRGTPVGITRTSVAMTKAPPPPSMQPAARGRRVSARLEVLGRSQKWLSEQTGIRTPDITKMLKGDRKKGIDPIDAWRIAYAIGLTEMYILYGDRQGLSPEVLRLLPPED